MAAPTADDIRAKLEGYGITAGVLSDAWINDCRDNEIIPHVEEITGQVFDGEAEITEYYNGTGDKVLMLNRSPINSITEVIDVGSFSEGDLSSLVELIGDEGILRITSNFAEGVYGPVFVRGKKNIKITYKYGTDDYPTKVASAIINLVAAKMLNLIGARTGGGSLGVQAFNRNYGSHGKWTDIRKELIATGYSLLKRYMDGVIGG